MANKAAASESSTLEQWLEHEWDIGGDHIIEQLREGLHERYADDPAVRRIIDRMAEATYERGKSQARS